MSEPDDLLGKADAFLKRYHPASPAAQHDVPVLTEVIAEARDAPAQPAISAPAEAPVSKADLLELEQRLKQSILDAVAAQVTDEQVKNRLRAELEPFIRETVARAVASEIARLRGPSRSS